MDAAPLLVRGLGKAYRRRPILTGVELQLDPGEAVALVGSNGAGKSTLLGCMMGDRLPDRGEIRVCGVDPFSDPARAARCMGSVPEQPFLYGELSVGEMLEFVGAARALPAPSTAAEGARLVELLGLAGAEATLCRELSQGMARKVAIIAALLHGPRVILLDEALNGLDQPSVERLTAELERRRASGASVLLSSHDLAFLGHWCDRGLFLRPGGAWTMLDGTRWQRWRSAPSLDPAQISP